jgi:hypothetical protein
MFNIILLQRWAWWHRITPFSNFLKYLPSALTFCSINFQCKKRTILTRLKRIHRKKKTRKKDTRSTHTSSIKKYSLVLQYICWCNKLKSKEWENKPTNKIVIPRHTPFFIFFSSIDITYHNKFINDENINSNNNKLFKAMLKTYIHFFIW